ncbi:DUF3536 domain-containing protein [Synechococcus sp. PCC 7336]|uniref:DUF3536 domain-containing protein n=1 Tax=Synechococcus sp. PCC 7336 TaxID=195250 RepID=UPI00034BDF57|nr:DUF3536 domain-containing protein [Synechococcus sp. PCC 7336]
MHSVHDRSDRGGALAFLGAEAAPEQASRVGHAAYVTIHGHFYQPPRENPYLDDIEPQPGAAPYENWNERILAECYRPNAFARILDERGQVVQIVNNYEYLSFNLGPTLMSWLERHDVEVYRRILAADRNSARRLDGHGNAIAQPYNHVILPLANERDRHTQIRWGIADFVKRFQRRPEGMWLPEAAIDLPTVAALVEEGIQFAILAPSQAQRCRPMGSNDSEWHEVSNSQIDPTQPYRCFLPADDPSQPQRYLDIFFYDGPVSRDMGFNDVVDSSHQLVGRLAQCLQDRGDRPQLIHCATDGETFGHHKRDKERTLAFAFAYGLPQAGLSITNYGHYLSQHPPTWEVQLKPVTAWSCAHGVGRWERDCGCASESGLHQKWRQPLRQALNWLRDRLGEVYESKVSTYLRDPWAARDAYIDVILDRTPKQIDRFLQAHRSRELRANEVVDVLRLLEMQRNSQLMFTSCGWFFEELSRPEGVQILRYAARAIELAGDAASIDLETEFLERLQQAPSNCEEYGDGAEIYRQRVLSAIVSPRRIAAHYAIKSLFSSFSREAQIYSYTVEQLDADVPHRATIGGDTLALGRLLVKSSITQESHDLIYGVLHLGGWDFHCCIQPFPGQRRYEDIQARLFGCLDHRAQAAIALQSEFGREYYTLDSLISRDRHEIMRMLTHSTLGHLNRLYRKIYQDNYRVLLAFRRDDLPVPIELQAAASMTLNQRLALLMESLERNPERGHMLQQLQQVVTEAEELGCSLQLEEATASLNRLLRQQLWHILHARELAATAQPLLQLDCYLNVVEILRAPIDVDRAQEMYLACLSQHAVAATQTGASVPLSGLLALGNRLHINVNTCLERWVQQVS